MPDLNDPGYKAARRVADQQNNVVKMPAPESFDPYVPPDLELGDTNGDGDIETRIGYEMTRLRVRREANRRLDDEEHPPVILPPVKSLEMLLAEPDDEEQYRIDKVAPADARIMLNAQWKAGKTTIVDNLVRALVDNEPFLGRFTVHTPAQHLVLIDDEMSERKLRRWLRDQKITNTAAVADVITLRGKLTTFNLLDDKVRGQWATRFRDLGCDYLALDCLRPILDALGLDEKSDAGKFLVAYDALLDEAGISDSLVVQHMGHANERARGDSRLQDWPDAIWNIVRENDQPDSARFFSAYGRDVDVHEGRLSYDLATRRLTYASGSRRDADVEAAFRAVIDLLAAVAKNDNAECLSKNQIEGDLGLSDHKQKATRAAIKVAVERELVHVETGPRNSQLHRIKHPCADCGYPVTSGRARHESCSSETEGLFNQ